MGMTTNEKHELTLAFDTSEELWEFAKQYKGRIIGVEDYMVIKAKEVEDGNDRND